MNKRFDINHFFWPKIFILIFCVASGMLVYSQDLNVKITIDAEKTEGVYKPIWSYFGYDEANYTTMKNGKRLLTEIASLSSFPVYVRMHNLLTSGDGKADLKWSSTNVYTEDAKGNPVYNWQIVDSIFDVLLQRGIRPIAEIGFMPQALSKKPEPYRHHWKPGVPYDSIYTGWAYPPNDYKKWSALIYEWVRHCIKRYGEDKVKTWYWEVWNEPNISYWKGTMEEYFTLYDYTVDAVKRALPSAKVGGPTTTGPRWNKAADFLTAFLRHCADGINYATGKKGTPLDYITFHAKGDPKVVDGHVQMNMAVELQDIAKGFEIVHSFPPYKDLPIIIGEFDPEGCAACSVDFSPQNAYRNGTMYSSYVAASFAQLYALAKKYNVNLTGAVSWSFEFENQKWFGGFRDLATNGVNKPVFNVFRMFGMMKGNMIAVDNASAIPLQTIIDSSIRNKPQVDALATISDHTMNVLLWNYHDDEDQKVIADISVAIKNLHAKRITIKSYVVDEDHSNSFAYWKKIGAPQNVSAKQFEELEQSGQLQEYLPVTIVSAGNNEVYYNLNLQPRGVCLLQFTW
jgi:xylan 1,4-beta-xylosidase